MFQSQDMQYLDTILSKVLAGKLDKARASRRLFTAKWWQIDTGKQEFKRV